MSASMLVAGALDYGVNVLAGRWLDRDEFGTFVAVLGLLQALLSLSLAIRMVVAFYTAELTGRDPARVGPFMRSSLRWSWRWGALSMAVTAAASPLVARALHLPGAGPLWAASLMVLMLFPREVLYGALQGVEAFTGLGLVQVSQAALRLALAAALVWAGARVTGAIAAQPLGTIGALALSLWWLRAHLRTGADVPDDHRVSRAYTFSTLVGLAAFGLLTNLDAVFVKRFFPPGVAGEYGTVVTFEKISLFLPWAVGLVLFPKVARRVAAGREPRPLLLVALGAALAPGLGVTAIYFLYPGLLVSAVFTRAYADPGVVLGLASLAATLYAGIHIWLNYALSTGRGAFVYALVAVVAAQVGAMLLYGRESLVAMACAMVAAGVAGNVAGVLTTWVPAPAVAASGVAKPMPET